MSQELSEALLQRARQHGGDKLLEDAADALRAVEGAWTSTVFEAGVNFGDEVFDIRPIANAHRTLIGKRVALVPLDAAGSAEGVGGGNQSDQDVGNGAEGTV